MRQVILVLWLLLLLSPAALAQKTEAPLPQPSPPAAPQQSSRSSDDDVVRITTNLVQVDAVVTDRNGKLVTDLRPDEVQIFEDGRQQEITNFSLVQLKSNTPQLAPAPPGDKTAPPRPAKVQPEDVRRTIALVVDDLGLSHESIYLVRQTLKKFVDQDVQPGDLVAIIRSSGGIGVLQQFTSDKRQLYAAAERVKWYPVGRSGVSSFEPIEGDRLAGLADDSDPEGIRVQSDKQATDAAKARFEQFREDTFTVGTLGALNYVLKGLRELPGRKSIVMVSDGFTLCVPRALEACDRMMARLRNLTDLANRASVVIHTIDARGLPTLDMTAADSVSGMSPAWVQQSLDTRRARFFTSQEGLNYLAQETGGIAVRNRNDLNAGLKRVLDDQQGYYLIGYRPDEATFDTVAGRRKFHKLSLKITRPGKFEVRMRKGFLGVTDDEATRTPRTRSHQLIGALTSPFGTEGVQLRQTSLFAHDPKLGSIMRTLLHVRGKDLTFTDEPDGWHKAVFDILAVTFGDNGVVVDQISRTETIRLKGSAYETVINDGFTYNLLVPVKKPGPYQLRAALRDAASERVGSSSQFIEVPDLKKNRLALSGVAVRGIPAEVFQKHGSRLVQNADWDFSSEADPNADAALRRFRQGLFIFYALEIYNAQLDKATGKPRLQTQVKMFHDGKELFKGAETPYDASNHADLKRLPLAGAIRLGSELVPGEYVFQVTVTDSLAKKKYLVASQWIDFEIIK